MRRPRRAAVPAAMLLGALLGWFFAPQLVAPLTSAQELDPAVWTVIVPGRDEGLAGVVDTGTGTTATAMVLGTQTFGRRDTVSPRGLGPIAGATFELADWSAPVQLVIRGTDGAMYQLGALQPGGWTGPSGTFQPVDGPIGLTIEGGRARVGPHDAGQAAPGTLELSSTGGESGLERAAITAIQLRDQDGRAVLDQRFDGAGLDPVLRLLAALGVGLVAACFAMLAVSSTIAGGLGGLLLLLAPAAILATPLPAWQALCARVYLTQGEMAGARGVVLGLALLPLGVASLVASGALTLPKRTRQLPWPVAAAAVLVAGAAASRDLVGWEFLLGALATGVLAIPLWTAHSAGQPLRAVVIRDAPALLAVAVGTWSWGLLPALAWRIATQLADVRWLNRNAPRAGVNAMLATALAFPLAFELGVRGTGLPDVWAFAREKGAQGLSLYWDDACGDAPRAVYYFGGSSTGGAYQFGDEPQAFFPGVLHEELCAAGHPIHTLNYGDSGRDSWDAANGAAALYAQTPPALAVVYTGVNDLLTKDHPLTKKERGLNERRTVQLPLEIINGLALLVGRRALDGDPVVAVPLADAEENLRTLIDATRQAGGAVMLVPEYTRAGTAVQLEPYRQMERRLADEYDDVGLFDPYEQGWGDEALADRNHLTRQGHRWLARALQPEVERVLD